MSETEKPPICFYYGNGRLPELAEYPRVVLQPDFYTPGELNYLNDQGVQTLGYLSLSEDQGPPAPWQRAEMQPRLGRRVRPRRTPAVGGARGRPGPRRDGGRLRRACSWTRSTWSSPIPRTCRTCSPWWRAIRAEAKPAYMLANRGFGMLPRLAELVDGVVFESFSARWTDEGYASWPPDVLEFHAQIAEQLLRLQLDLYALDYADTPGLTDFAIRRARQFGMQCVVSDRALSQV